LLRYDSPWEKGYQIEQVYEAWVYESEQKGVGDDKGHFTGYVNMFLKIKQESSGWPRWVTHREDGVEHPTVERLQKELEYVTKYRDFGVSWRSIGRELKLLTGDGIFLL
jgi:hypothetical protein